MLRALGPLSTPELALRSTDPAEAPTGLPASPRSGACSSCGSRGCQRWAAIEDAGLPATRSVSPCRPACPRPSPSRSPTRSATWCSVRANALGRSAPDVLAERYGLGVAVVIGNSAPADLGGRRQPRATSSRPAASSGARSECCACCAAVAWPGCARKSSRRRRRRMRHSCLPGSMVPSAMRPGRGARGRRARADAVYEVIDRAGRAQRSRRPRRWRRWCCPAGFPAIPRRCLMS